MSVKVLAKMTARGVVIDGIGKGQILISAYDVAAALSYGSLPHPAYHLGLAKYCDDAAARDKLYKHIETKIQHKINSNNWQDAKERASCLALLVMQEAVYGLQCKVCHGRGFVRKRVQHKAVMLEEKQCQKCHGLGVGILSERKRAAIANIPKSSWIRNWILRIEEFKHYVVDLETKVIKQLAFQFSA
ncbi:MAG: hypothetical protein V3T17_05125 [Pseudomonadales bacterium]